MNSTLSFRLDTVTITNEPSALYFMEFTNKLSRRERASGWASARETQNQRGGETEGERKRAGEREGEKERKRARERGREERERERASVEDGGGVF